MWVHQDSKTANGYKVAAWVGNEQRFYLVAMKDARNARLKVAYELSKSHERCASIIDVVSTGEQLEIGTYQRINPDGTPFIFPS